MLCQGSIERLPSTTRGIHVGTPLQQVGSDGRVAITRSEMQRRQAPPEGIGRRKAIRTALWSSQAEVPLAAHRRGMWRMSKLCGFGPETPPCFR